MSQYIQNAETRTRPITSAVVGLLPGGWHTRALINVWWETSQWVKVRLNESKTTHGDSFLDHHLKSPLQVAHILCERWNSPCKQGHSGRAHANLMFLAWTQIMTKLWQKQEWIPSMKHARCTGFVISSPRSLEQLRFAIARPRPVWAVLLPNSFVPLRELSSWV